MPFNRSDTLTPWLVNVVDLGRRTANIHRVALKDQLPGCAHLSEEIRLPSSHGNNTIPGYNPSATLKLISGLGLVVALYVLLNHPFERFRAGTRGRNEDMLRLEIGGHFVDADNHDSSPGGAGRQV